MLRAKQERSPKPMLLTVSLSGWHKDDANQSFLPPLAGSSKGPRSFQLRGPFALPGLRHDIPILFGKHGFEGMIDDVLTRLKPATFDGVVDRSAYKPRNPDVHLPIAALFAGLSEALNALGLLCIRHGIHLLHSCRFE
jgi:hypothetical protein